MASITVNRRILDTYAVHQFAAYYGMTRQQALGHLMALWLWAVERSNNQILFAEGDCDMAFVCAIMGIPTDGKDGKDPDTVEARVMAALEDAGIVRELGDDPNHIEIVFPDGVRIVPPHDEDE